MSEKKTANKKMIEKERRNLLWRRNDQQKNSYQDYILHGLHVRLSKDQSRSEEYGEEREKHRRRK